MMKIGRARHLCLMVGKKAVSEGVLTSRELDIICRKGHRKNGYWNRHLLDLIDIITQRLVTIDSWLKELQRYTKEVLSK